MEQQERKEQAGNGRLPLSWQASEAELWENLWEVVKDGERLTLPTGEVAPSHLGKAFQKVKEDGSSWKLTSEIRVLSNRNMLLPLLVTLNVALLILIPSFIPSCLPLKKIFLLKNIIYLLTKLFLYSSTQLRTELRALRKQGKYSICLALFFVCFETDLLFCSGCSSPLCVAQAGLAFIIFLL